MRIRYKEDEFRVIEPHLLPLVYAVESEGEGRLTRVWSIDTGEVGFFKDLIPGSIDLSHTGDDYVIFGSDYEFRPISFRIDPREMFQCRLQYRYQFGEWHAVILGGDTQLILPESVFILYGMEDDDE